MARIKSEAIHQAEQRKRQLEAKLKAGTDATSVDKKKRRKLKKSRARALRKQMRELQSRSSYMVPRATMQRLIRQIGDEVSGEGRRLGGPSRPLKRCRGQPRRTCTPYLAAHTSSQRASGGAKPSGPKNFAMLPRSRRMRKSGTLGEPIDLYLNKRNISYCIITRLARTKLLHFCVVCNECPSYVGVLIDAPESYSHGRLDCVFD